MRDVLVTIGLIAILMLVVYAVALLTQWIMPPMEEPKDLDDDAEALGFAPRWPSNRLTMNSRQVR